MKLTYVTRNTTITTFFPVVGLSWIGLQTTQTCKSVFFEFLYTNSAITNDDCFADTTSHVFINLQTWIRICLWYRWYYVYVGLSFEETGLPRRHRYKYPTSRCMSTLFIEGCWGYRHGVGPNRKTEFHSYRYIVQIYIIYNLKLYYITIHNFLSSRIINTICRVSSFHEVSIRACKLRGHP